MSDAARLLECDPLEGLPDEDLLAALLAPGRPAGVGQQAGRQLIEGAGGMLRLSRLSPAQLRAALGPASTTRRLAAARLVAAFELGRRAARAPLPHGQVVTGAADLEPHLRGLLDGKLKEQFLVILLDAKNRPIRTERVSEGCLTWSVVHPREVFAPAVRESAGAVIVAHNHPSGDPTPSSQDIEVTARLQRVGELLGVPLLDHIVVGRRRCVSMRAAGLLGATTAAVT